MSGKKKGKPTKKPVTFVRPQAGHSQDDLVDALARPIIDAINKSRAEKGLPPLPKE